MRSPNITTKSDPCSMKPEKPHMLPFVAPWMGLESVILSEVRQQRRNII